MRMPKLPPNAADYGVRDNMFNIGVDMPDIKTELLTYDAETIRQFAACMEVGWRREWARRLKTGEFISTRKSANQYAQDWAEWSEKHAPVTKTV